MIGKYKGDVCVLTRRKSRLKVVCQGSQVARTCARFSSSRAVGAGGDFL